MHQTRKGNQWYFGLKAHIGADAKSGLVHSVSMTAANVSDITQTHVLLHGKESEVHADAGYLGVEKREEIVALKREVKWQIAAKRGTIKRLEEGEEKERLRGVERTKAQVRAKVEHPFHVVKNLFHYRKTRYRGLAKNTAQLEILFALANLFLVRNTLQSA